MSRKSNKITIQSEEFARLLIELKPQVNSDDIKLAVEKRICSQPTISRYLNGEVAHTGVAMKLVTLFKKQIERRNSILA